MPRKGIKVTLFGVDTGKCQENELDTLKISFVPIIKSSATWWRYLIKLTFRLPFMRIPKESVIHVHRIEYVLPFIISKRKNPVVLTLHGERLATAKVKYQKAFPLIEAIYRILEYFIFKRANVIVAVSNKVKESFENVHKNISDKIIVLPVGVDMDEFKPLDKDYLRQKYDIGEETKVLLFAGVLEERKNIGLLIRAFRYVQERYPDSILLIVGDGPLRSSLEKLVEELKIKSKVWFLGEVSREQLPESYNLADVFALPSLSEGSPTVVREALACGIPVVSTDVGDVKEIITDPLLGTVVNTYTDERVFAEALIETIENIDKNNEEIKKRCRDIARKYSFENVVEKYVEIYHKLRSGEQR